MKKLIVLAIAALVAAPAFAGEMKWSGSTGWKYTSATYNDGLNTNSGGDVSKQMHRAHAFRANLGATGGWKNVEWGTGVRTTGAPNSDWTGGNNAADMTIGLEQAWFRYVLDSRFGDWGFTFGRQMNVFAHDSTTESFFDNDVRFDGVSMAWNWGSFGLNAGNYFLDGRTGTASNAGTAITNTAASDNSGATGIQQRFVTLTGVQPHFSWKFRDDIETMFAVGYYSWNRIDGLYTNAVHGVSAGTNGFTAANTTADSGTVSFGNARQWQFYNTWSLPYKLAFSWELVTNKNKPKFGTSTNEAKGSALAVGLTYGSIKRAHDFKIGYAYGSKDLGSVINRYSNRQWLADNKGHFIHADYALADNFELGVKGYMLKEKSKMTAGTGVALATTQDQKSDIWELTAGVSF